MDAKRTHTHTETYINLCMENAHPFHSIHNSTPMLTSIFSFLYFLFLACLICKENFYSSLLRGLHKIGYLLREQKFLIRKYTDRAFLLSASLVYFFFTFVCLPFSMLFSNQSLTIYTHTQPSLHKSFKCEMWIFKLFGRIHFNWLHSVRYLTLLKLNNKEENLQHMKSQFYFVRWTLRKQITFHPYCAMKFALYKNMYS